MESGSGHFLVDVNQTSSLNATDPSTFQPMVLAAIPTAVQLLLCGIVLRVFYTVPSLRTVTNLPILNLIASDVLRAITIFMSIPLYSIPLTTTPSTADIALCQSFFYLHYFQFAWSGWAAVLVAYSRADVIVNALDPKFNKKKFWMFALTTWVASALTALPPLMGWSSFGWKKRDNVNLYRCLAGVEGEGLAHAVYVPLFFAVNFLVPFVLVIVSMFRIVQVTKRHLRAHRSPSGIQLNLVVLSIDNSSQSDNQGREDTLRKRIEETIKSKAFRYVMIIVVSNLLLLSPYVIAHSYDAVCWQMGSDKCLPDIGYEITSTLFTVNFNANALLYVFWIRTFQQATIATCCRRRRTAGQR